MSGGSPIIEPESPAPSTPATASTAAPAHPSACDDFPAETHQIDSPSEPLVFDSPEVRPPPLPPGASQPNSSLQVQSPPPSQSRMPQQSPLNHKASRRPPQKFSLLRKKGKSSSTPPSSSSATVASPVSPPIDDDDDDEWLLEGTSTNGHVNATVSVGREASNLSRSVDTLSLAESDAGDGTSTVVGPIAQPQLQPPAAPNANRLPGEKRVSKSRALAKKTSRLFSRNGHHHEESSSSASLTLPGASTMRQNSISSNGSSDSRQKPWSLSRVSSSKSSPPPRGTPDSSSQPSSWHPPPAFALRRTPSHASHTTDSDVTTPVGIPQLRHHESTSHLSTSVPVARNNNDFSSPHHHQHSHYHHPSQHSNQSSLQRPETTLPSRMSSWFSNLLPTATAEQSSPSASSEPAQHPPGSPLRKPTGVAASIFSAARNKAVGGMRYLLDSEAQPDHCQDTMWVMGVPHPGYTPEYEDSPAASPPSWATRFKEGSGTYSSSPPTRSGLGHFFGSALNLAGQATSAEPATPPSDPSRNKKDKQKEPPKWPEQFYDDFRSRVWCTYRSQYAPILPLAPGHLLPTPETYFGAFVGPPDSNVPHPGQTSTGAQQSSRLSNGPWGWVKGDERGLTSDAGWGCMLRTGQSLLANALIHLHLGRGWRLPPNKPSTTPESPLELAELEAYATYVRILSWFFDDPSPLCPFSVHRMALIGKELGKEVGEWFGPSTAAGALKTLVNSFPLCGLSVVNAVDGIIYRSDVYAASNISSDAWVEDDDAPKRSRPSSIHRSGWGGKSVLILIGIRLGLDGVNPIYYDSIKTLFTFPHSVGIAGGRPSSSYYFVASQANSLFYLDPHFTRPAIPLRVPPPNAAMPPGRRRTSVFVSERGSLDEEDDGALASAISRTSDSSSVPSGDVVSLDNEEGGSSPVSALLSPSKPRRRLTLTQTLRIKPSTSPRKTSAPASPTTPTLKGMPRRTSHPSPSPSRPAAARHSTASSSSSLRSRVLPVDPQTAWYASAYSETNLKTFHCEKVKKLPLSGLDPSMLLGFLCQTEAEFDDFCERVAKLPQKIFVVQDEPPLWSEDEDGLESVSEPASDGGSELDGSDKEDEPDLDMDDMNDMNEFGNLSRPLGPKRDDTITPLTAAAAGLGLETRPSHASGDDTDDADDADTEEERDTAARRLAQQTRRSSTESKGSKSSKGSMASKTSKSSQNQGTEEEGEVVDVAASTATIFPTVASANAVEGEPSNDEPVPSPISRITRPVDAATPPRPVRPSRLDDKPKKRQPPQEIAVAPEPPAVPPPRPSSLRGKASLASLNQHAAINIPGAGVYRRPKRVVDDDDVEAELLTASDDDASTGTELVYRSEREGGGDDPNEREHDPDLSFDDADLAYTPSSAPVLVERPSPAPAP